MTADEYYRRGIELEDAGNKGAAAESYRAALASDPRHAKALNNLGAVLHSQGDVPGAIDHYERALNSDPGLAQASRNLAAAWLARGQAARAQALILDALGRHPEDAELLVLQGDAARALARFAEAAQSYRRAISRDAGNARAHMHLGIALHEMQDADAAEACHRKALELRPDFAEALVNLGTLHVRARRFEAALECFIGAAAIDPAMAQARFNAATLLLLAGDYEKGWEEYEWRWQLGELKGRVPQFDRPSWDGSPLTGKTILLFAEQGFGDAIQFVRYAAQVEAAAARVIIRAPGVLTSLLRRSFPKCAVVAEGERLPPHDFQCALLSLPRWFRTSVRSIPASVPYLRADPDRVSRWASRLPANGVKVGLCWASESWNGAARSLPLRELAPLARMNAVFCSLQVGSARPPDALREELRLLDFSRELRDFDDTAALIQNLDLVISIDTAVTHIAGALAKPTWTLIPFIPDWRWGERAEQSPWYPTMRLFRQRARGDWTEVCARLAAALAELTG